VVFLLPQISQAATINVVNGQGQSSCEQIDVQNAINNASDGDTVQVPTGTCTWTQGVSVNKGIFIKGAGESNTTIIANTSALFGVNVQEKHFRLSGFRFSGTASSAYIVLDGKFKSLRIDHSTFEDVLGSRGILLGYNSYNNPMITGLFDHLTIGISGWKIFLAQYGNNNTWNKPDNYGTNDFVFIEDSTISGISNATPDLIDGERGARFVVRKSILNDGMVQYHDTGGTPGCRSTRVVEIYKNKFICTLATCPWTAISFRGGTGVYYDNSINSYPPIGYEYGAATQIVRAYSQGAAPWNTICDGTYDRICSDFSSHCSAGDKRACLGNWDCSGAGTCSIHQCNVDSDCGTSATCLIKTDGHQDSSGWPCRDQTGRGMDDPTTHEQASSPAYWWNNKDEENNNIGVIINGHGLNPFPFIFKGRDFYENIEKPGYVSYIYPHPLTVAPFGTNICGEGIINLSCWCEGQMRSSGECNHGYYSGDNICTSGDANDDKSINISDVQTCINVILNTDTDPSHQTCSDMNGDTNINIADCQGIINKILGT